MAPLCGPLAEEGAVGLGVSYWRGERKGLLGLCPTAAGGPGWRRGNIGLASFRRLQGERASVRAVSQRQDASQHIH